jgi:hypothetical protein
MGKNAKRLSKADRAAFFADLDALAIAQKRGYEATRRRRLREFGHLFAPLEVDDASICYYCEISPARTQDHSPSLLALDSFGTEYFASMGAQLVLVPACMTCNNEHSGQVVFRNGSMRKFSWQTASAWLKQKTARAARARRQKATRVKR